MILKKSTLFNLVPRVERETLGKRLYFLPVEERTEEGGGGGREQLSAFKTTITMPDGEGEEASPEVGLFRLELNERVVGFHKLEYKRWVDSNCHLGFSNKRHQMVHSLKYLNRLFWERGWLLGWFKKSLGRYSNINRQIILFQHGKISQ